MSEFKSVVARMVERMRPECEQRDAWSVAEEFVPHVPDELRDKMAVEFLVAAYFRAERDHELRSPAAKPRKRSPKRDILASSHSDDAEIESRFWTSVTKAVDQFKEAVRAEITAEMLTETFELHDGTVVSWGEATSDQHRLASLDHQITAGEHMKVASRHEVAIEMLTEAQATCLSQCVSKAA